MACLGIISVECMPHFVRASREVIPKFNQSIIVSNCGSYRRPHAEPDLVPRGEGAGGVRQDQDGHAAGQEDLLPLLPRDIQRGGGHAHSVGTPATRQQFNKWRHTALSKQ